MTIKRLLRKFPEDKFPRCAKCGKIAASSDPVMTQAIWSVGIEMPKLKEILCDCEER